MLVAFGNRAYPPKRSGSKDPLREAPGARRLARVSGLREPYHSRQDDWKPKHVEAFLAQVSAAVEKAAVRLSPGIELTSPTSSRTSNRGPIRRKFDNFTYAKARVGIFALVHDLFGLTIRPWQKDKWDKDVETYSLHDGEHLVVFFLDMRPWPGNFIHAETRFARIGRSGGRPPMAGLLCNFPRGPSLPSSTLPPMRGTRRLVLLSRLGRGPRVRSRRRSPCHSSTRAVR